jgi:hypothetical protein
MTRGVNGFLSFDTILGDSDNLVAFDENSALFRRFYPFSCIPLQHFTVLQWRGIVSLRAGIQEGRHHNSIFIAGWRF